VVSILKGRMVVDMVFCTLQITKNFVLWLVLCCVTSILLPVQRLLVNLCFRYPVSLGEYGKLGFG
jgi:hypothetical protein